MPHLIQEYLMFLILTSVLAVFNQQPAKFTKKGDLNEKYPFVASVQTYNDSRLLHICGCGIISFNFILTSADCLDLENIKLEVAENDNLKDLVLEQRVIAGSSDVLIGGLVYLIEKAYFPKYYQSEPFSNNIAIGKVTPSFDIGNSINTIVFPNEEFPESDVAYFAGWGSTKQDMDGHHVLSNILQEIKLNIITNEICEDYDINVLKQELCTVSRTGKGLCYGDHGGPLIVENGTLSKRIIAIATKKYSCGDGLPEVFIKVRPFIDWINATCSCIF